MTIATDHIVASVIDQDRIMSDFTGSASGLCGELAGLGSLGSLDLMIQDLDQPAAVCAAWTFCI